jgi:hypothetical protein
MFLHVERAYRFNIVGAVVEIGKAYSSVAAKRTESN